MVSRIKSALTRIEFKRTRLDRAVLSALSVAGLAWSGASGAFEINTDIPDLHLQFDNTVKYSAAFRTRSPSASLTSPSADSFNSNQDDGDRNFNRGLISNRVDLLSEFDATYNGAGLRFSAAGWYDEVYNRKNDNPGFAGGAYPNQLSTPYNRFVSQTRKIEGRDAELLDAFGFANFQVSDSVRGTVRLGKHGLVWGETLFFGDNGIAGGMMPIDALKLASVPSTQFKEAIRPVPMISGQLQLSPDTSVGAYYQFRWERSRVPTVGSYFSNSDILPEGGEQYLLAGPGSPFLADVPRRPDQTPKKSGQGGLQLRSRIGEAELGAYLIRYHAKTPQPVFDIALVPVAYITPGPGCVIPNGPNGSVSTGPTSCAAGGPANYQLSYGQDITSVGVSGSQSFGDINIATEWSLRNNQPLFSGLNSDNSALDHSAPTDDRNHPGYPVGRTAHINVSTLWSLPPNPLFREGVIAAEFGWNRVLRVTRNPQLWDVNATRGAEAVRGLFQATYRQVIPGLDLAPSLGAGWSPKGSRSAITATSMPQNGNGDASLGLDITYQDVWRGTIGYTHYIGTPGGVKLPPNNLSYQQSYADRDFVSMSVRRSF